MKKGIIGITLVGIFILTSGFKNDFFAIAKQIELFTSVFKEITMNYVDETNPAELMDTALTAMLRELDPYTQYYNQQEVEQARINQSGEVASIGARIKSNKNKLIVVALTQDAPADQAGLKPGDELVRINDITISEYAENAINLLNGAANTSVNIAYKRQGKIYEAQIKRSARKEKAVPFYNLDKEANGYIVLKEFTRTASFEVGMAAKDLIDQGAKRLILDLRNNPGGLLSEAVNVANLFVPKNTLITYTQSNIDKYNQSYKTKNEALDTQIPLAILINAKSASASEIVAGSLQDLDRAVIIGGKSFGKGLVQRPKNLSYGSQVKITISRYYTPSGRCIQALDYSKNGQAIENKKHKAFKTKAGRIVYDAGGITPDVSLASSLVSPVTQALLDQGLIFDFSTQYFLNNKGVNMDSYPKNAAIFKAFDQFLKKVEFNYETNTEKDLKKLKEQAEKEGMATKLNEALSNLELQLKNTKAEAIERQKEEILYWINKQLLSNYFYEKGAYEYFSKHNSEILEAKRILSDTKAYADILNKA